MAMKILKVELSAVVKTVPAMGIEEMVEPMLVPQLQKTSSELKIKLQWGRVIAC